MLVRVALGPKMSARTSCSGGHRIWMRSRLRDAVVSSSSKHSCGWQIRGSRVGQPGCTIITACRGAIRKNRDSHRLIRVASVQGGTGSSTKVAGLGFAQETAGRELAAHHP